MEKEKPGYEVEETEKNQARKFRERSALVDIFMGEKLNKPDKYSNRTEKYSPEVLGDIFRSCGRLVGIDTGLWVER